MANESVYTYASQIILEASGAQAASAAFAEAADTTLTSANHLNFPEADFALTCNFGGAVAAGKYVSLYRQDNNIDGAADAPDVSASYKQVLVGIFNIPSAASASATYPCVDVPLTKDCGFWIGNDTDQTLSAGWVLKATAKTFEPSA